MLSVLILQASTKVNVSSPRFTGLVSLSVPVEDIDKPQTFRAKPVKARSQVKHLPQSCFIVLDYCLFCSFLFKILVTLAWYPGYMYSHLSMGHIFLLQIGPKKYLLGQLLPH